MQKVPVRQIDPKPVKKKLKTKQKNLTTLEAKEPICYAEDRKTDQDNKKLPRYMWPTTSSSLKSSKKQSRGQELVEISQKLATNSRKPTSEPVPVSAPSKHNIPRGLTAGRKTFASRTLQVKISQPAASEVNAMSGSEKARPNENFDENKENLSVNLTVPPTEKIKFGVPGVSSCDYRNVITILCTETDDSPRDKMDETLGDVSGTIFDSSVYFTPKVGGDFQIPDTPWTTLCNKFNKLELQQSDESKN